MKNVKIAWITDSTATLSKEFIEKHNIHVIPLSIIFGETSYRENIDISSEDFYTKLANSKELPKTSQPSPGDFEELYEKLRNEYDKAIAIHASSSLTGTYQGSLSAADMTGFNVEVIDSKIGSYPLGKMIEKGIELEIAGLSFDQIVTELRTLPDKARLLMTPGSLEQLQKGGRLSSTQALIGNLIQLKFIVKFDNGKAILADKIRTEKKVKSKFFETFQQNHHLIKEASIVHGNNVTKANEWKEELQVLYPSISFTTTTLSPVAGTHLGQGTLGLAWINE